LFLLPSAIPTKKRLAVIDNSGVFKKPLDSLKSVKFELNPPATVDNFYRKGFSAILFAPHTGNNKSDDWQLYSRKSFGVITPSRSTKKSARK